MEVPPERLVSWIITFTERHGGPLIVASAEPAATVTFAAADGATAECHVPFPPSRTSTTPIWSRGVLEGAFSTAPTCSMNSTNVIFVGAYMTLKSNVRPCHSQGFLSPLTMWKVQLFFGKM